MEALSKQLAENMAKGDFLIILGKSRYTRSEQDKWLRYHAYLYTSSGFEPMGEASSK